MKKFLLFLFLLFSSYVFTNTTGTDNNTSGGNEEANYILQQKIATMERQIYIQGLIQYIELESEIIIPGYIDTKYVEYIYETSKKLEVPVRTAFRMVFKESTFRDTVVSPAGAVGLMQLMPGTRESYYNELRVDTMRLDKNQEDIYIGLYYVKDLYGFWSDRGNKEIISWKLCLASYNSGKGTVLSYKGIPPYKETQEFVAFILKQHSNPVFYAGYIKKYGNDIKNRT
jgi:soluble lytic murein transglycosylase-like protein